MASTNEGHGAEQEKDPQAAAKPKGQPLKTVDLNEVNTTTGMITFSATGTSVDVSVTVPDNTPALEDLTVYGASNNSNPSSSEANKLEHKATRPTDGKIARNGNTCTAGENYTIQLKFWYHGEDRRTVAATILGGSSSVTNTNVTLN
jgi:hypothetical protein